MRIRVDPEKCQGHNRCCSLAPALFEVDEYGSSTAVDGGRVPRGMEATAELAIDNCPEFAITVIEK